MYSGGQDEPERQRRTKPDEVRDEVRDEVEEWGVRVAVAGHTMGVQVWQAWAYHFDGHGRERRMTAQSRRRQLAAKDAREIAALGDYRENSIFEGAGKPDIAPVRSLRFGSRGRDRADEDPA